MFDLFKKDQGNQKNKDNLSLISVAALLIHSAKIDENFTEKEKLIIIKDCYMIGLLTLKDLVLMICLQIRWRDTAVY